MDSPPDIYDLGPFVKIAEFLLRKGFKVPKIYSKDYSKGFLLMEDFGDTKFVDYLAEAGQEEKEEKYRLFMDLAAKFQSEEVDVDLPIYDKEAYFKELKIYLEYYPKLRNKILDEKAIFEFFELWSAAIDNLPDFGLSFVHRDYHVENLMKLQGGGLNEIGILDFQDALVGHKLYDVVSILEDARYFLDPEFSYKILDYYLDRNNYEDKKKAYRAYRTLGAQRNSKILGVFARKFIRDGSDFYLKYLPRVEGYLKTDIEDPGLKDLKKWYEKNG